MSELVGRVVVKVVPPMMVALVAVGCTAENGRSRAAQFDTVSGGRVVVSNRGDGSWTPEQAWRLEEDLRLGVIGGGESDPARFGSVASIAVDSRSRIYVLDGQAQEVRIFDRNGGFVGRVGQPGEGPGEFEGARAMVVMPGDTLIIRDDGTMRYSVFGPGGAFIRSHRRTIVGTNASVGPTALEGGQYLDWAPTSPDGRFGATFHLLPIRYSADFSEVDTLPPLVHEWEVLPNGMPHLYHTGGLIGSVDAEGALWFAEASRYQIHRRDLHGDTTLSFDLPAAGVPLGEPERTGIEERFAHLPEFRDQILSALPDTLPLVQLLLPDNAGHILVFPRLERSPENSPVDVFGVNGVYRGRLDVPSELVLAANSDQLAHATANHLFVVAKDALDVPFVVRYRIVKPD